MQVAPVEAAPTKPPVIAIKPASAATLVKPVAVVPRPVIETVRLLETPSRADVTIHVIVFFIFVLLFLGGKLCDV